MRREARATVVDTRPGAEDSHAIEMRRGFSTVSRCSIEKTAHGWHLHSLATPEYHRGRGYAKRLVRAVEAAYSPVYVRADNPGFWRAMGYEPSVKVSGLWSRRPSASTAASTACSTS